MILCFLRHPQSHLPQFHVMSRAVHQLDFVSSQKTPSLHQHQCPCHISSGQLLYSYDLSCSCANRDRVKLFLFRIFICESALFSCCHYTPQSHCPHLRHLCIPLTCRTMDCTYFFHISHLGTVAVYPLSSHFRSSGKNVSNQLKICAYLL